MNCGYGRGLSVLEVLDAVDRIHGSPIERVMEGRRAGDPPLLISANGRILQTLDWRPAYDNIDTIVRDALVWEKKLVERAGRGCLALADEGRCRLAEVVGEHFDATLVLRAVAGHGRKIEVVAERVA